MPDYDGTGPLKRGRLIGRGLGPCGTRRGSCPRKGMPDEQTPGEPAPAD